MSSSKSPAESSPLFLAGHPALDFLNTRMRVDGELVDFWQSNEDVLRWLERAGLPVTRAEPDSARLRLLDSARRLRENIRTLVEKRKAGRRGDPSVLNEFLAEAKSYPQLGLE
jgi:predicted RNA-binding Zn ribbon-like protein